jgi:tetratricopeptide (TPR) repeat protein
LADAAPLDKQRKLELVDNYIALGSFLSDVADTEASREAFQSALNILTALAADDSSNLNLQRQLSELAFRLLSPVEPEAESGNLSAARVALEKWQSDIEQWAASLGSVASSDSRLLWHLGLARIAEASGYRLCAFFQANAGEPASARESLHKARDILVSAILADSQSWLVQNYREEAYRALSEAFLALNDDFDAQDGYRQALGIIQALAAKDPENPRLQHRLVQAYGDLGRALLVGGQFAAAREASEKAHDLNPFDWRWGLDLGHTYPDY